MPATPDGRLAGEPLADSIGPQGGSSRAGPTALLASVRKLNAARHYSGGYNLNLTLGPGSDAKTVDSVLALTDVFFAQGGQELQIAALDAWTLLKAREHPEQYPGLLVRIAGFNALFGRLSRCEQDELIARAQAVA
jgi:formate C-acetyltransferase